MKKIIIALCFLMTAPVAYAYSGLADIWGFSHETLLSINRIIDTLPGINLAVGWGHKIVVSHSRDEYIIAIKNSINDLKKAMLGFAERKFALTSEDFSQLSQREPELAERAVTFDSPGDNRNIADILDDAAGLCDGISDEIQNSEKNGISNVRTSAKKIPPHLSSKA